MFSIFSKIFSAPKPKGRKTNTKEIKNLTQVNRKQISKYRRSQLKKINS